MGNFTYFLLTEVAHVIDIFSTETGAHLTHMANSKAVDDNGNREFESHDTNLVPLNDPCPVLCELKLISPWR